MDTRSIGWKTSKWHRFLHDSRAELGVLEKAEVAVADAATVQIAPRVLPEDAEEEDLELLGENVTSVAREIGQGVYAHLYSDPEESGEGPAWARSVVGAIQQAQDLENLQTLCTGDPDMAAIATATIMREVAAQMPTLFEALDEAGIDPQAEPGDEEGEEQGPQGPGASGGQQPGQQPGEGDGEGQGPGGSQPDPGAEALAAAVAMAMGQALREVSEAKADLDGLLPGLGSGHAGHQQDPRRLALLDRIRTDKRLQQVLRIAGRIHRVADQVRRVPSPQARQELSGLERGADLQRVLPSELAGLKGQRGQRLLALKGIADRGLLQKQQAGHERLGRGPMCVLLDASDSMGDVLADGLNRIGWASAVAIAAVRAAVEQRRPIAVAVFDGRVRKHETWEVPAGDLQAAETAVLGIAGVQQGGGTVFDGPVSWALDKGAEKDRADLIIVTDGYANLSAGVATRLEESRKRGLRCWGVIAGEGGFTGVLEKMSDGITKITGAAGEDSVGAVGSLGAT